MKYRIAAVWIALQTAFFVLWAMAEQSRFAEGKGDSILVRTLPVDPRDLLRGQYMQLAYSFSRPGESGVDMSSIPAESTAWITMKAEGKFHEPVRVSLSRPDNLAPGEVTFRGRWNGWVLDCGVDRLFVEEGTPTPTSGEVTVRLRVADNGSVRIEQVYLDEKAWP